MLRYIICAVLVAAWIYLLSVLDRAKLNFWHFIAGSLGLFLFLMVMRFHHQDLYRLFPIRYHLYQFRVRRHYPPN